MPRAEPDSAAQAARTTHQKERENPDMNKLAPVLATLASATLVVASTGVAGADPASPPEARAADRAALGPQGAAIVVAWNRELLHIVQIAGAQPATVHQTRSYALLHAAIYDAVVSSTKDARPYLV